MKKKFIALGAAALMAITLVGCNKDDGNVIKLEYSGTGSNKDFNEKLFEKFKEARKAAGDEHTYQITYLEHGPDKVDSEVQDWEVGPDVYEFASDKITGLYEKGALAKIVGDNEKFVKDNNSELGVDLATFNGGIYAYPYTGDNTYYLQYDKSVFSADDVKTMEGLLAKAKTAGKKVGYNLKEGFWGGAAMFTFGADYSMTFDADGAVKDVTADFDTAKGLKAAKAIYNIMHNEAWTNEMAAPTPSNGLAACIAGTWDISSYKEALGENYACAIMPTITVDGETKNLGAFLGGKLFGINPQRAGNDTDRLLAAHELAKFMSGKEAQMERFIDQNVAPCNKEAAADPKVTSDENIKILYEHSKYAHAQTAVPSGFWNAPVTLTTTIAGMTSMPTDEQWQVHLDTFNKTVKSKS